MTHGGVAALVALALAAAAADGGRDGACACAACDLAGDRAFAGAARAAVTMTMDARRDGHGTAATHAAFAVALAARAAVCELKGREAFANLSAWRAALEPLPPRFEGAAAGGGGGGASAASCVGASPPPLADSPNLRIATTSLSIRLRLGKAAGPSAFSD